jgi:hypothetical protein
MAWYDGNGFKTVFLGPSGTPVRDALDAARSGIDNSALKDYGNQLAAAHQPGAGYANAATTAQAATGLIRSLQGTINGQTPSFAQQLLRQQTGQNTANAFGNAAQGINGGNSALALRHAQDVAAGANQQAAMQGAQLRAQEIANAQGALGGLLNQQTGAQLKGQEVALQGLQAPLDIEAKNKAAQMQFYGGIGGGAGSALTSLI